MSRGGGGSGSSSPEGPSGEGGGDAWRRIYDRVEELAADRARLEAANKSQHEPSEAREKSVHGLLLQAEASRERWKTAYIQLPLLGNPKIAELQESDLVDSRSCEPPFHVDNSQLVIKSKEAGNCVETSQENADNGGIVRELRAELRKLKQAYKTLCSNKDKEISAANDFLLNQLRIMDKDNAGLLKTKEVEEAQANEAAQKLRQNVEELQVAVRNRDAEIGILRAEAGLLRIKAVEAAQANEAACSNKDKEISAVNDFLLNQLRRMDKGNAGLLKIKEVEAAQANEAAQKLRQNVEELQVAVRNRDDEIRILQSEAGLLKIKVVEAAEANDAAQKFQQNVEELQVAVRNRDAEIGILRAEAGFLKIKEVEAAQANDAAEKLQQNLEVLQVAVRNMDDENARLRAEAVNSQKRVLVLEGKLLEMHSLVKEKNDEIQQLENGQPESLKCKCASFISNETNEDSDEMDLEQCTHSPLPSQNKEINKGLTYKRRKQVHGVQNETVKAAAESRQIMVADNLEKRQKNITEIVMWKETSTSATGTRNSKRKRKEKGISTQPEPLQVLMPPEAPTSAVAHHDDKGKATKRLRVQDQDRTEEREDELTNDTEDIYVPNSEDNDNEDSEAEDDEQIKTVRRGTKRKTIAKDGDNKKRFETKVHGSFRKVLEAWKELKTRHKEKVEIAGFGNIKHCRILGVISRSCICFLMNKIDTKDMTISFGGDKVSKITRNDKVINITSKAIHDLFGFPNGPLKAPKPSKSANRSEDYRKIKKELGFNSHKEITVTDLLEKLKEFVQKDDTESDNKALKVFFLIVFHKLVCAPHAGRIAREAPMVVNMKYEEMAKMNFCQVIVEEIKRAATAWQTHKRPIEWQAVEGLAIAPLIMYLDSLIVNGIKTNLDMRTPRANYLNEKELTTIAKKDMKTSGGKDPDAFEYGKTETWKEISDRVFYYEMDAEAPSSSLAVPQQTLQQVAGDAIQEDPLLLHY